MEPSDGNENIERFMVGVGYSEDLKCLEEMTCCAKTTVDLSHLGAVFASVHYFQISSFAPMSIP